MGQVLSFRTRNSNVPPSSSIDQLTDDQVYELIIAGRQHEQLVGYDKDLDVIGAAQVYRIAPDAVAKLVRYPEQHEAFTMQYVAERTSIPIPHVRKVLLDRKDPSRHWIVMDSISGQTLVHCWRTLSIWRKLCIMCTLWWYIHQVKSLPLPNPNIPGPFDGTGLPLLCRGTQFPDNGAGPLKNYQELVIWFDYQLYSHQVRLHRAWGLLWKSPKFPQPLGSDNSLVFCHNDLNMRNIMLDDNNRVWLLDWEYSGAYPPWFDYAVLQGWANAANPDRRLPRLFRFFIPMIAGNHRLIYHKYWKKFFQRLNDVSGDALAEKLGYFKELGIDMSV